MYQVQTYSRTSLLYSFLLTLALFMLASCATRMGPKPDKPIKVAVPAVPPKVTKSPNAAKSVPKVAKPTPIVVESSPTPIIKLSETTPRISESAKPIKSADKAVTPTPCNMADPGYGIYYPWVKNLEIGRMLMPKKGALTSDGGFDLIIHFHGGNAIRKAIVDTDTTRGVFIVGVDLGAGSAAYERPFKDPEVFKNLLKNIEKEVAKYTRKNRVHIRRLALTGWSAGYGAIRAILRQQAGKRVDAVALLDGLHSNYDKNNPLKLRADQLRPFVRFAKNAASGEKTMFVSHSSIVPPGYASTTETSHYLTKMLGISISRSSAQDSPHLSRYEEAKIGNFLMRGYRGKEKDDHCAQIALITRMAALLEQQWNTPFAKGKGYRRPIPTQAGVFTDMPSVARDDKPKSANQPSMCMINAATAVILDAV